MSQQVVVPPLSSLRDASCQVLQHYRIRNNGKEMRLMSISVASLSCYLRSSYNAIAYRYFSRQLENALWTQAGSKLCLGDCATACPDYPECSLYHEHPVSTFDLLSCRANGARRYAAPTYRTGSTEYVFRGSGCFHRRDISANGP